MPPVYSCGFVENGGQPNQNFLANPLAICTDNSSVKWVKINFHYMLDDNGGGNFNSIDDGIGNTNMNAFVRSEMMIAFANNVLANNQRMWLPKIPGNPIGNNTPTLPIRVRFLLTGVYFHKSSADMASFNVQYLNPIYGVNTTTELNYYFTRSIVGGVELDGHGTADGIGGTSALGSSYAAYLRPKDRNYFDNHGQLFLHETGHILNLRHTWNENDGCDDTPLHGYDDPNTGERKCCYFKSENSASPCFTWENISNNVMDYNNWQSAYTPCQIDRIHIYLNGAGNSYVHSCGGCAPVNAFFDVSGCFKVPRPRNGLQMYSDPLFLDGRGSVNEDKYKITICEVPSVGDNTCSGGYFNTGLVSGSVEKINLKDLYTFVANKTYRVELEVASSSCFNSSVMVKFFQISSGGCSY
jgi:hypothetical protein